MKSGTHLRIVMMALALAAVLWLIRTLNKDAMEKAFDALGLKAGGGDSLLTQTAGQRAHPGQESLNLCPTRIVAFIWDPQITAALRAIEERHGPGDGTSNWWAIDSNPRQINSLDVEKWLTTHCRVLIDPADEKIIATISARLPMEIRYVDGSKINIDQIGRQYFRMGERYFESEDLAAALKQLRVLAQFDPPAINMPAKVAPKPASPSSGEIQQKGQ